MSGNGHGPRARDLAASLQVIPGQTIRMPIAVAFEFMLINELEFCGVVSAEYGEVRRKDSDQMAQKKPLLEKILQTLVDDAEAAYPNMVKVELKGGLTINLRRSGDEYVLTLWRLRTYPSHLEWKTVCAYMPHRPDPGKPEKDMVLDRFFLRGKIPAQAKRPFVQLEF